MNSNQAAAWLFSELREIPDLGNRIFPDQAPEGTPNPCAVYQEIEAPRDESLDAGAREEGMVAFQVRFYADTRAAANALRETARQSLANREPETLAGWRLQGTAWGDGQSTYDAKLGDYGATAVIEVCGE